MIGQTIAHYRIIAKLGAGGMGREAQESQGHVILLETFFDELRCKAPLRSR